MRASSNSNRSPIRRTCAARFLFGPIRTPSPSTADPQNGHRPLARSRLPPVRPTPITLSHSSPPAKRTKKGREALRPTTQQKSMS